MDAHAFNTILRAWMRWSVDTWSYLGGTLSTQAPHQGLRQALHEALLASKVAIESWAQILLPAVMFIIKLMLYMCLLIYEITKSCYTIVKPSLFRFLSYLQSAAQEAIRVGYDKLSNADPKVKMGLTLALCTLIALYFLRRWLIKQQYHTRLINSCKAIKKKITGTYDGFITRIKQQSQIAANIIPHGLYFGMIYAFYQSQFGELIDYIPSQIILTTSMLIPCLSTIYTTISLDKMASPAWVSFSSLLKDISSPSSSSIISTVSSARDATPPGTPSGSHRHLKSGNIMETPHKTKKKLDHYDREEIASLTAFIYNIIERQEQYQAKVTDVSYTQPLQRDLLSNLRFFISIGVCAFLYILPFTGHAIQYIMTKWPHVPLLSVFWLQFPLTDGASLVVKGLSLLLRLVNSIPILSLLVSTGDVPTTPSSSSSSSSSGGDKDSNHDKDANNNNNSNSNNTNPSGFIQKWISTLLSLPLIPHSMKSAISQLLSEAGLLLIPCSLGLITPTFITTICTATALFLRPVLAATSLHTRLLASLEAFPPPDVLDPSDPSSSTKSRRGSHDGDDDGDNDDNDGDDSDDGSSQFIYSEEYQQEKEFQDSLYKKLSAYSKLLLLTFLGQVIYSKVPFISALPLSAQCLLAYGLYLQIPCLAGIPLLMSSIIPFVRYTFLSLHCSRDPIGSEIKSSQASPSSSRVLTLHSDVDDDIDDEDHDEDINLYIQPTPKRGILPAITLIVSPIASIFQPIYAIQEPHTQLLKLFRKMAKTPVKPFKFAASPPSTLEDNNNNNNNDYHKD